MERHTKNERFYLANINRLTNPKLAAKCSKGTPEDWATESLQAAKEAYCLPGTKTAMKSGTRLGEDYC
jgi:hypothetical protein